MGRTMLIKSLFEFSVENQGYVPSLYDLRQNYDGGIEDNGDLLPMAHACTTALSAPNHVAGWCQHTPLLVTPGYSQASLGQSLVGSLLLSPGFGLHKVLFVPSKSLFIQSCVSSGSSMVGLMVTSSKGAYAMPRSAAPRVSARGMGQRWPAAGPGALSAAMRAWGLLKEVAIIFITSVTVWP